MLGFFSNKTVHPLAEAGEAKRMRSSRPKVLHPLCGRPLIAYPVAVCRALGAETVVALMPMTGEHGSEPPRTIAAAMKAACTPGSG